MEELKTEFDNFIKEWQQRGYSYETLYAWIKNRVDQNSNQSQSPNLKELREEFEEKFVVRSRQFLLLVELWNWFESKIQSLTQSWVSVEERYYCIRNKHNNVLGYGNTKKYVTEDYKEQFNSEDHFDIIELVKLPQSPIGKE